MATALEKIITWASTLPDWQSDAVRRLLLSSRITKEDEQEIIGLLKARHGLIDPKESSLVARSLKPGDLSGAPARQSSIVLKSIDDVRNVNAIPDGAQISFGVVGLTAVYGENGSGKSGYARLLKRACRARDASELIHPNIFTSAPAKPASAVFHVAASGSDQQVPWHDGADASPLLSAISVFDGRCARVIIDKDNEAQYLPFGAQVFEDLVAMLKKTRDQLLREKPQPQKPLWPDIPATTSAGKLLEAVTAVTDTISFGEWTDGDETQLLALAKLLAQAEADDPIKAGQRLRNLARRLRELAAKLNSLEAGVSTVAETALVCILKAFAVARQVLEATPRVAAGQEPLKGVGCETWQLLYRAAREYSIKEAYPSKGFPELGPEARCPLCMQRLEKDAKVRMARFRYYMEQSAKKEVERLGSELETARSKLPVIDDEVITGFADAMDELRTRNQSAAALVPPFIKGILARATAMRAAEPSVEVLPFATVPTNPAKDVISIAKTLEDEAAGIEKTANLDFLNGLRTAKQEKDAYKTLLSRRADLDKYIKELKLAAAYDQCYVDCDFRHVTAAGKRIISEALTPELQGALTRELQQLGASHLSLTLKPLGAEGETRHRLEIKAKRTITKANLTDILSEGEQRVVAIAGFLAELEVAKHASPIVFDDPVSSLDHKFRLKTAERLIREAVKRQVIMFTHDLSFLMDLQCGVENFGIDEFGRRFDGVSLTVHTVERLGATPGHVVDGLPWCAAKVTERLNTLVNDVKQIEPLFTSDRKAYNEAAARAYGRLRETWESFIEEILFNGAVQRFQAEVKTQSLKEITITTNDAVAVFVGMAKASSWMTGHDKAKPLNIDRPDPTEIRQDIQALQKLVATLKKRRDLAKSQFKTILEAPSPAQIAASGGSAPPVQAPA